MPANDPREVFLLLLSDVRQRTERSVEFYRELNKIADSPEVKQILEARAFIAEKTLDKIDQAFKLINEKPVTLSGRLHDVFVEDFRRELAELKSPVARRLLVLAKVNHLTHLHIGEYTTLVAAADMTGNFGIGVLLASCLADHLSFVKRNRRIIRRIAEEKIAGRATA